MARFDHIDIEKLVVQERDGVKVINDYNLMYGGLLDDTPSPLFGDVAPYSDEGIEIFQAFLKEKGITYYAAPREDFFVFLGFEKAQREGNKYLIMEDLS